MKKVLLAAALFLPTVAASAFFHSDTYLPRLDEINEVATLGLWVTLWLR